MPEIQTQEISQGGIASPSFPRALMPVPGPIVHALGAVVIMGMGAANGNLGVDGGVCAWIAGLDACLDQKLTNPYF